MFVCELSAFWIAILRMDRVLNCRCLVCYFVEGIVIFSVLLKGRKFQSRI